MSEEVCDALFELERRRPAGNGIVTTDFSEAVHDDRGWGRGQMLHDHAAPARVQQ
jgi:hypothetical protein